MVTRIDVSYNDESDMALNKNLILFMKKQGFELKDRGYDKKNNVTDITFERQA